MCSPTHRHKFSHVLVGMEVWYVVLTFLVIILLGLRSRVSYVSEISRDDFDSYVINLKTNKDRRDYISSEYNKSDLVSKPFVLVEAVDGRTGDIKEFVTQRVREGLQKIEETGKRVSHDHLTRGMVGCYLSHLKVLEMIKSSSKPYGLVLEDDASFPEDVYTKHIKNALLTMPEDWDVILLGRWPLEEMNEKTYVKVNKFWGTHGYLVNRQGAEKIIKHGGAPIDDQIDGAMGALARQGVLKIYAPYRNVIRVNTGLQSQVQMNVSN